MIIIALVDVATSEQRVFLERVGVDYVPDDSTIVTARLDSSAIGALSDQDWVVGLQLSARMQPMSSAASG